MSRVEGWLYKSSTVRIHRSWRKRYFILQDKEIVYSKYQYILAKDESQKSAAEKDATSVIDLTHYRYVSRYRAKASTFGFRIEANCKCHKSYLLYADNQEDGQRWYEALSNRIAAAAFDSPFGAATDLYAGNMLDGANATNDNVDNDHTHPNEQDSGINVLDKWLARLDLHDIPSPAGLSPQPKAKNAIAEWKLYDSNEARHTSDSHSRWSAQDTHSVPASPSFISSPKATRELNGDTLPATQSNIFRNVLASNNNDSDSVKRRSSHGSQPYYSSKPLPTWTGSMVPSSSHSEAGASTTLAAVDNVYASDSVRYLDLASISTPSTRKLRERSSTSGDTRLPPPRPPPTSPLPPTPNMSAMRQL